MRWNNKGHEFDSLENDFKGKKVFLYGCGEIGTDTYYKLKYCECVDGFIDNFYAKDRYLDKPVFSFENFCEKFNDTLAVIIVCVAGNAGKAIMRECSDNGWSENRTLFNITESDYIIPFVYAYCYEMLYLKSFSLSVTEYCSLKCKECALSFPYFKKRKSYGIEDIKDNIDILFKNVDYIYYFEIIGGEPFLYPQLEEVLNFIHEYYSMHIGKLVITTNATILPTVSVLETIKKVDGIINISDYSEIENLHAKTLKLEEYLKENQIEVRVSDHLVWSDFGLNKQNVNNSCAEAECVMAHCGIECVTVQGGKLYYCFPALNAGKLFYPEVSQKDNYIDLNNNDFSKREMMEWLLGYRKKGYLEMCKHCYGQYGNPRVVTPGIQLE